MRRSGVILLFMALPLLAKAQIYTSPLEYNPAKFFNAYGVMMDDPYSKSLYPIGSKNFYIYDTVSLPFIDDFSVHKYKNYDTWAWQTPVDSVSLIYTITPQPSVFPFNYKTDTTKTYSYTTNPFVVDSSIVNPSYQIVFYGDSVNPFEPRDTLIVWEITSYKYFIDTLTLAIDSLVILPDGTLTSDSTDTIQVFNPLPDSALWVDNFTYRNFSMGIDPPSLGVATFDGTNEFGEAYSPGGTSSFGVADYLTSVPIDLNYPASDSLYFSFFYQPQGRGYAPDVKDSLVLEFYSPITELWYHALNLPGGNVDTFKQAMVPITDTVFLQRGFRLRFKNYGNLSGNLDHWNIDYVRLDRNRTFADTIIQDVAFVQVENDILRRYSAMPYTQFQQSDVNPKWNNLIGNLGDVDKTICYKFELADENGVILNRYTEDYTPIPSDTNTIQPRSSIGYTLYPRWYEPDFNYDFQGNSWLPLTDSTEFTIKHYLQNFSTDTNAENDTVLISQRFYNYFSYDDGTAEQALWLGTPGFVAMKFTNNVADTLRAIQFYFSPVRDDVQSRFFTIKVWVNDLDSGEVYSQSRQIGVIQGDQTAFTNPVNNGFTTYYLQDTVLLPAGDFYVGWYQNQTFKINLGFDKNTDNKQYTFYKTTGVWDTLFIDGTPMIRPMVGPPFSLQDVGVEEIILDDSKLSVYPNPSNGVFRYSGEAAEYVNRVEVMDISGKLILTQVNPVTNMVDISGYPSGFYFIRFGLEGSSQVITRKVIVSH